MIYNFAIPALLAGISVLIAFYIAKYFGKDAGAAKAILSYFVRVIFYGAIFFLCVKFFGKIGVFGWTFGFVISKLIFVIFQTKKAKTDKTYELKKIEQVIEKSPKFERFFGGKLFMTFPLLKRYK
jgi:hypothetical protein